MAAESKTKYDRQLRIWGEQGQAALEKASICLLNCGPTGSEALKNLVLGGIGSITVVDGSKVEAFDLGNNFMLDEESLGQSKAKCVCAFLQELNDAVKAKFVEESPETLIETKPSFFSQFTLVIATQILESYLLKLDKICWQANVMLVVARSYGLTGLVRISMKEHVVIESKPDHFLDDLRLHNPWPELKQYANTFDLNVKDAVVHKHIPYIIILINIAEEWANSHGGNLPSTRQEKRDFKDQVKGHMLNFDEENYREAIDASFKVSASRGISSHIQQIISDSAAEVGSTSPDFWVLVAALKEFIENEGDGEPPLEGSIPDMTSLTEYYINLQKIYQAKAESDCLAMEHHVRSLLKKIGRDPESISKAYIKNFCKNARKLSICRYRQLEDEYNSPVLPELQKYLTDEDYSFAVGFYILLRAVDRFAANYNRFPGMFDGDMDEDISWLKTIAVGMLNDLGCHGSAIIPEDLINEMCRFGGAELHAVAALIGGIASEEVIKLVTKQFVPLTGTFIFNGIDQKSQVLPF
ncbi:NEDD8-activating enzyme E1 regulatory subunit AXR1-like [Dioscorea cayenensis subsp. rotundata]|uniref:NEDD8-activating enzyme E1 regulatory subunit n=1 Tax=Dioscorea cayennensis subsp. rotundata TaxID=55577 RepID=A0AB40BWR8_DIOCR|nr:NEDD8-activating enzyme E1 regulatory subunit AXR1-like [Dioscorea cayenensis subsp. rotundata]